jgi:alkanesulfonate monooxygenase SsuD/methylene tetrahydromethanopterin reductase-like flavin-dependent oxidoreductase (luciferase family)
MKFGLLLPHFGEHADRDKLLDGSKRAEELGFSSVWVRDHLAFEPHAEMEKADNSFYEALTTLTAIGAVTERLVLGTGSLIPFRHPLETALIISTMTQLFGPRIVLGMGAGTFDKEFEAVGLGGVWRPDLVESNAHILRQLWTENDVSWHDDVYEFHNLAIDPKPVGGPVPYWYCGNTPASARRAVEYCEGWMPGRITLATFKKRVETIRQLSEEKGREMPTIAVIPPTSVADSREEALADVNVEGLLRWANEGPGGKYWVKPPSGRFEKLEDLEGSLLAGDPDDIVAECKKYEAAGNDHLVFDFRFKFNEYFEQIELLGTEVLPKLRSAD